MRSRLVLILLVVVFALPVGAQSSDGNGDALEALSIGLKMEQALLDDSLREYESAAASRDEVAARLVGLREALDAAVGDEKAAASGRLDELIDQVQRAAGERLTLYQTERGLLARISERRKRIVLLTQQIAALEGREEEPDLGVLTGTWDLVMLPVDQRGTWMLKQEGAVVGGTYQFSGGWTGSLQGTLVDRKLYLVRIDTKLGKMMEFEAYLSLDGQRLRGTWLNYELAGSEGSTGQWTAERRAGGP